MANKRKLNNTTWVLGEKPTKTLKRQLTWTEGKGKAGLPKPTGCKVGGPTGM
jgi:hypothetical protein